MGRTVVADHSLQFAACDFPVVSPAIANAESSHMEEHTKTNFVQSSSNSNSEYLDIFDGKNAEIVLGPILTRSQMMRSPSFRRHIRRARSFRPYSRLPGAVVKSR